MNISEISKSTINLVSDIPNDYRNKILKLVFSSYLLTEQERSKTVLNLSRDINIPKENLEEILGVYLMFVTLFLRFEDNEFVERLTEIGFSPEFIENLPLIGNRDSIIENLRRSYTENFGKLSLFRWRIDISLSNSDLVKVPNVVVLSITLTNRKKYTIELDPTTFHKLRYSVSFLLNQLNSLRSNK
ncbi:COMM domain-containing protein 5 [Diabrotica undecimpunctata]|uniref:COMM domain-containing protein 5 n=1 Tax=Diabrotica undecimpunctata TaxID=50387 RepID=UPI003B63C7A1